jgi:4-aminobutyrate aminotransferase/(S)-3-amino-2-methylpropionate transaminase
MPNDLPRVVTAIPGPRSCELAKRLERVECPEVTALASPPIFWERASGANVWDVDGNRYVDLLAGFGVAPLGYAHPEVVARVAEQAATLPNALADVHPARLRVELLEALERRLPGDLGCAILSLSGSDAVESALKTALRATGRPGVVAFEGAYHGLGLGALDVTHRAHFREPFEARLPHETRFVPTGLGRTGHWLACEAEGVLPDVVALGKALGGGLPISACAGRPEVMRRWGPSSGEALHTSTHLGNPVGCAAALAVLEALERERLLERASMLGGRALARLERDLADCDPVVEVRGRGLMLGIELDSPASAERALVEALRSGWILIGESEDLRVLSLTPALNISEGLLQRGLDRIVELCSG